MSRVWLDHFVVAIDDLDAGISAFEALTGVRPVYGGEHPNLGTHNALVSLGPDRYLEIVARRPGASLGPLFRDASGCVTLTPILLALATNDVTQLHRVITSAGFAANEPSLGSRVTADGEKLRWSMFMMNGEGLANAPFFIEWDASTAHPSSNAPAGCSLDSFTVTSPNHENVQHLFKAIDFAAAAESGAKRMMISLQSPKGPVTLGS